MTLKIVHLQLQESEDLQDYQVIKDIEDKEQSQEIISFAEEDTVELFSRLSNIIKVWKSEQSYEPLTHKQQLSCYNIIDTSLDAYPLTNEGLNLITEVYIPLVDTELLDLNVSSCNSFESLKLFYNDNKHSFSYVVKRIIKASINQRYEEHLNLFTDYSQKEDDYKLYFIAPLFKALFGSNENIKRLGESFVGKTKINELLFVTDDEGFITN